MNRKNLYLNLLAAALLLGAGTAQAARNPSLDQAIRLQTLDASAAIQAELRADLHAQPLVVYVPGVSVGEIRLVKTSVDEESASASESLLQTTAVEAAADMGDALRRDLAARALEVPGLFGVYRYMAASALTVAIIVAE